MPVYNESRKNIIRLIFIALFVIIIARLLTLQIFTSKYQALAEDQGPAGPWPGRVCPDRPRGGDGG